MIRTLTNLAIAGLMTAVVLLLHGWMEFGHPKPCYIDRLLMKPGDHRTTLIRIDGQTIERCK